MYTTLGVRHLLLHLLLIKCGLSSRPICIGFCQSLQVVIEMYYCSACYRPMWGLKICGGWSMCGECRQLACCNLKVMCCRYNGVRLLLSIAFLSNQPGAMTLDELQCPGLHRSCTWGLAIVRWLFCCTWAHTLCSFQRVASGLAGWQENLDQAKWKSLKSTGANALSMSVR